MPVYLSPWESRNFFIVNRWLNSIKLCILIIVHPEQIRLVGNKQLPFFEKKERKTSTHKF